MNSLNIREITLTEEIAKKLTEKCQVILDYLEKSYVSQIVIKENVTWSSWDEWTEKAVLEAFKSAFLNAQRELDFS